MNLSTQYATPELLAPGGNLQKLQVAFRCGADAVYVGGTVFGLRKYADNFTDHELRVAVDMANSIGRKVYVVLNGFAHDADLTELVAHLNVLQTIQPHAFLVSDWGVAKAVRDYTSIPLHVSTQASVTNIRAITEWIAIGAERVVMAREVSIDDCKKIKEALNVELELFIHGSMCASYSGKCVISNYSAGRDSNRGGCVQSCRHTYTIESDSGPVSSHIMNAKDLQGIRQIEACVLAGIDSLKIEGRMKSQLYVANAVSTYRDAIDAVMASIHSRTPITNDQVFRFEDRLKSVSNRQFSAGGLSTRPDASSINRDFGGYQKSVEIVATGRSMHHNRLLIECKDVLCVGDAVMRLNDQSVTITHLFDCLHMPVDSTRPGGLFWMMSDSELASTDIFVVPL